MDLAIHMAIFLVYLFVSEDLALFVSVLEIIGRQTKIYIWSPCVCGVTDADMHLNCGTITFAVAFLAIQSIYLEYRGLKHF